MSARERNHRALRAIGDGDALDQFLALAKTHAATLDQAEAICARHPGRFQFERLKGEAGVISWKNAAQAGRYDMSIRNYRTGSTGDLIIFGTDAHHIGFLNQRVNLLTGSVQTIEGNTSGPAGKKDGLWRRQRNAASPQMVIRVR